MVPDTLDRVPVGDKVLVPGTVPGEGKVLVPDRVAAEGKVLVPDRVAAEGKVPVPDTLGIPGTPEQAVPPFPVIPEVLPVLEPLGLVLWLDMSLLQQMENNEIQSRCQHLQQKLSRPHYRLHGRL